MQNTIDGKILSRMFLSAANHLNNEKKHVDDLNVFPVPDGDTGTNMSLTALAVKQEMEQIEEESCSAVADIAASASLRGARGNSGVILSQFFRGFAKGVKGVKSADIPALVKGMQAATETAYRAVMKPTEGTILTVARETAEAAEEYPAEEKPDIKEFLAFCVEKAKESLERTPEMLPALKQAKVVDAGGRGLVVLLEGALHYLEHGDEIVLEEEEKPAEHSAAKAVNSDEIKFGYCTEFLIKKVNKKAPWKKFRKTLEYIGDCVIVIDDKDLIKVHVHSNNPGIVLEEALKLGQLINIKIDNMREQNENLSNKEEEENPLVDYGFVAVAVGSGITQMFSELGCQGIIEGGQTMNPSTDDILQEIEKVNARTIFVLPNNKNIILAAEQAKEMTAKNVVVIPTTTIVQGISCLLAFNPEATSEENADVMTESISVVKSGSITFAARDSEIDGMAIKKDDIMGLIDGKIRVIEHDVDQALRNVIEKMVDDNTMAVSLFYGENVAPEQAQQMLDELTQRYPEYDVNLYPGGQPLYYYFISVE